MEKAYDLKVLVEYLKEEGAEVAEESAKGSVRATFKWLKESAAISENKVDDIVAPFLPNLESYVLEKAEDINPSDNE